MPCDHLRSPLKSPWKIEDPRADCYLFYPRGNYSPLMRQRELPIHFSDSLSSGHILKEAILSFIWSNDFGWFSSIPIYM